jgi:hypothetical protein
MVADKRIIDVQPGMQVKFKTGDGRILRGTVKRIDEGQFPGVVFIESDDGQEHQVSIAIGWPTEPR